MQDVNVLSNQLISSQSAPSQDAMEAVRSARASLTAAVASVKGSSSSPLPLRENIAPNQHSWTETSERMGAKKTVKRRRLPEDNRLAENMTDKAIGIARGKCRLVYTDPYAGGERPGRLAKPDAVLAAANRKAHACAEPLASQPTPAPTLPPTFVPPPPTSQPNLGPAFAQIPFVQFPLPPTQALATQGQSYSFPLTPHTFPLTPHTTFPPTAAL
ncbi:hypothetical protein EI94DRAFT_1710188 [Lactarius quietus]|nr:hypothetical protein EI94DRAFT_1710188 [Lactarius quietus]